jgi:UDP-N-acetyl-D-glucosamine dehydrogenase
MAKLLENTYRHVNIALVNEMAILCHELGIDIWEVIEAASTKPFGFQPFFPGPGWGGPCIPVDPVYLSWRARQRGHASHFIELAQEMNERMPAYVVQRIGECLKEEEKSLEASSVLLLGAAYKADVADLRESPALGIISGLRREGASVAYHDPYVGEVALETGALARSELSEQTLREADIVVVVTNHSTYDWAWVARHAPLVLDTRNALKDQTGRIVKL